MSKAANSTLRSMDLKNNIVPNIMAGFTCYTSFMAIALVSV